MILGDAIIGQMKEPVVPLEALKIWTLSLKWQSWGASAEPGT